MSMRILATCVVLATVSLATGQESITLSNNVTGDGHLVVSPDSFGAVTTWPPIPLGWENRDEYDPAGPSVQSNITFAAAFYVYVAGTDRVVLAARGHDLDILYNSCGVPACAGPATIDYQIINPLVGSDSDGDGVIDTADSTFQVFGGSGNFNLLIDLHQVVTKPAPGSSIATLVQQYTIANNTPGPASFNFQRQVDLDLLWDGTSEDVAGSDIGPSGLINPYMREANGDPLTPDVVSISGSPGYSYVAGKSGFDPDGPGPDPVMKFGTDFDIWNNFGLPGSWQNYTAGIGHNLPGELPGPRPAGSATPWDAFMTLDWPVALAPGDVTTIETVTTYGSRVPDSGPGPGIGACCLPGGLCVEIFEPNCSVAGGVFQGPNTVCGPAACIGGGPPICACPGDMDASGGHDGRDIGQFTACVIAAGGGVPPPGCECADVNEDLTIDLADVPALVDRLLNPQPCPVTMSFPTSATIVIEMFSPVAGIFPIQLQSAAPQDTTIRLDAPPYQTGQPIQTEMLAMVLSGIDPFIGPVLVNESRVDRSFGVLDNVVVGSGGEIILADSMFDVYVEIEFPALGVRAFNPGPNHPEGDHPVHVESIGNTQLPPEVPHQTGPNTHVPLVFDDPLFQGEIISVIHTAEPVCIYRVSCLDGPCNDCDMSLGDLCTGAPCPNGTCSTGFSVMCGTDCCLEFTLVACAPSAVPPCPTGNFCVCDPTPGACCLPDGSCVILTEAECKEQGGPNAYQGDGSTCAPPQKCCLADGTCIDTDPNCCVKLGGTVFAGLCQPVERCCFQDGSCRELEPDCCTQLGGTPDGPGLCLPPERCCLADGTCVQADPVCCVIVLGGTPDGPGPCLPPERCCLADDTCVQAEPGCCATVLGGTPTGAGLCLPIEACCFPDGSCTQAEPSCCTLRGGTPDGVGPCQPIEACCLPDGSCIQAEPFCCLSQFGGTPDGVRACQPIEACCLPDGTCVQAEPACCTNVLGGTPDGLGPCIPLEACCLPNGMCVMADPFCCANALGGTAQGTGTTCTPNPCVGCDITGAQNIQMLRGNTLDDQVINATTSMFRANVTLSNPGGQSYFLRWTFLGQVSAWQGPYNASPSGVFNQAIPADAAHKLNEQLKVDCRLGAAGAVGDTFTRNMKVFFDLDATNDTHNRPAGNANANWFRHWGGDEDNACSTYRAVGNVAYHGKNMTFSYGGAGPPTGQYNGSTAAPAVQIFDQAHAHENRNFQSVAMNYNNSTGVAVAAPAGAITITFNRRGIDLINHTVIHEAEHLHTDVRWLGPTGDWFVAYGARVTGVGGNDRDGDELPNLVEDGIPGYRWDVARTHAAFYLAGDDEEVWCEQAALGAGAGTATNDWAFEGKQSTPSN